MAEEKGKKAELDRIRDRKKRRGKRAASPKADIPGVEAKKKGFSIGHEIRGWLDALFFAFLLAMFIRAYVFELFMIPTGSMTPTLIGDDARHITEADWDNDGQEDIVVLPHPRAPQLQVHLRGEGGLFDEMLFLRGPSMQVQATFADPHGKGKGRRDMIMVNKFAYWFSPPERGDIVVFKVPDRGDLDPQFAFNPEKPVFIKRCVGLPSETVTFQSVDVYDEYRPGDPERVTPDHYGGVERIVNSRPLLVDGEPLTEPPFDRLHHFPPPPPGGPRAGTGELTIEVPGDSVLMIGDNQMNSQDSRFWGPVPRSHLRGKAILRHLPIRAFGFLYPDE